MSATAIDAEAWYTASLLRATEQAGEGVLTLAEGLADGELKRSRLTRRAITQQLQALAQALAGVPALACQAMPEIDWAGWRAMPAALGHPEPAQADDALLMCVHALVPATLMWLRVYRPQQPQWFAAPAT